MQVAEIMSRASVTDSPVDPLTRAADLMWSQQTGSLLVMDGDELLGIVTERDVMKAVARGLDLTTTPVSAVMTTSVLTVAPDTSLHEAAGHMATRWIRHLPVVADGRVIGMVSQRDLCGVLARMADEPQVSDGPDLVRDQRMARIGSAGGTGGPAAAPVQQPAAVPASPSSAVPPPAVSGSGQFDANDARLLADRPPHWQDS